jgi:hypothetical protein
MEYTIISDSKTIIKKIQQAFGGVQFTGNCLPNCYCQLLLVDGLESGVVLSFANVLNQVLFKLRVDLRLFIFRQPLF